jgi:hypothetical protein
MGSRGSDYDDGIKENKEKKPPQKSKAELRIEAEGTKFRELPRRGLGQSIYFDHASTALSIMQKAKSKANLNRTLDVAITERPNFIRELIDGSMRQSNGNPVADGGMFVSTNSQKTLDFIQNDLGYSMDEIGDILAGVLTKDNVFNMKYSDKYSVQIGKKTEFGQIFEFHLDIPDKNGDPKEAYVKLINIHGKNGEVYSVIDSVHKPDRDIVTIWPQT